jgi:hypothetical protein
MAQPENGKVGLVFPPDIYEALQKHTEDLAAKGDPMLTEASVCRAFVVEGLRRAGKLKKERA